MPGEAALTSEPRLTIHSRLEDIALLWPWVESIAEEHAAPAATRYAIHLCLEEALSNIVRHGYGGQPGRPIVVEFSSAPGELVFSIEDEAPPFDPLAYSGDDAERAPSSADQLPLGGQGIRLMRKFAGRLSYTRLAHGNRLSLRFPDGPI